MLAVPTLFPLEEIATAPVNGGSPCLNIDVAGDLCLPANAFIGQRVAILGSSGFGKSNSIAVMFEELAPHIPITIFDPHGEYYGLTQKFDILHVGKGEFVDIEAGVSQAESIAKFAFANRVHVIVNMLEMSDDDRLEFTYIYCKTLWELNRRIKKPMGVILDEAHIFIPETKANIPALRLMIQFALEGRKFGFTVMVSDQRVATINKSVLAQCGIALMHGVDIYNDMQAYQGMLPYSMNETKKIAYTLKRGQAIVKWTFEGERGVDVVQIRKRHTFHASDTPTTDDEHMPELRRLDSEMIAELKAAMTPASAAQPVKGVVASNPTPETAAAPIQRFNAWVMLALAYQASIDRLQHNMPVITGPDESCKNLTHDTVIETQEVSTVMGEGENEQEPFRSPRALARAIGQQQRAFDQFMRDLRTLPPFQQLMLVYLTNYTGQELEIGEIARFIGISDKTLRRNPPTWLLDRKMLYRRMFRGGKHYYRSTAHAALQELYPDLDGDTMIETLTKIQRLT